MVILIAGAHAVAAAIADEYSILPDDQRCLGTCPPEHNKASENLIHCPSSSPFPTGPERLCDAGFTLLRSELAARACRPSLAIFAKYSLTALGLTIGTLALCLPA